MNIGPWQTTCRSRRMYIEIKQSLVWPRIDIVCSCMYALIMSLEAASFFRKISHQQH